MYIWRKWIPFASFITLLKFSLEQQFYSLLSVPFIWIESVIAEKLNDLCSYQEYEGKKIILEKK